MLDESTIAKQPPTKIMRTATINNENAVFEHWAFSAKIRPQPSSPGDGDRAK